MAVDIKLKRSSVPGKIPTTSSLELGEIALNTYDGKAYMKKQVGNIESIVEIGSGSGGSTVSASYALNAGFANSAGTATTANSATTSSYALVAANATSASYVAGVVYTTGNQTIGGLKTFENNAYFKGTIYMDGSGSSNSMVAFKQPSTLNFPGDGYSGIGAYNNNEIRFYFNQGGLNYKEVAFNNSNVPLNSTVYLTVPAVGGTLLVSSLLTGSVATASLALNAITASYFSGSVSNAISASYASASVSASYASSSTSASYAETASYAGNFTVAGTLTAQTLVVQVITSSQELVTGSLIVSGSLNAYGGVTGSLLGTASWANNAISASYASSSTSASYASSSTSASYALFATSASYASSSTSASYASASTSASYASNADLLDGLDSTVFTLTSSFQNYTSSNDARVNALDAFSSSILSFTSSANTRLSALEVATASLYAFSSSILNFTSSTNASISALNAQTASLLNFTSSTNAAIASIYNATSSLQAATASLYAFSASILNFTSSYRTGSFTGSFTGSLLGTASFANNATTASYALNATTASYALNSTSASYAVNATSASYAVNAGAAQTATSASFATQANSAFTASSADNFTVRGTLTAQTIVVQTITSSISVVTGSMTVSGALTVLGGITGSLFGTASWSNNATTASYALVATSASFASTAASAPLYLPLAGGTMTGNITFTDDQEGIVWSRNSDGASIKFYNTGNGDTDSRLEFNTIDDNNEYFRWTHSPSGGSLYESMRLVANSDTNAVLTVSGKIIATSLTGSLQGTASWANNAITASHALSLKGISNNYVPLGNTAGDVSNSVIYQTNSNIGIGTTSPSQKLDVAGVIRSTGELIVSGSTATIYNIANGPATINLSTFYSGGEVWNGRIISDYYGQTYTSSIYHGMSFVGGRAGLDHFRWFDSSYTELMTLRNSGNLLLGAGNNPSENWWRLHITGSVSGSIYVASGISYFGGNVGIGTTSPNSILEISSSTPVFRIAASDNSQFHGIEFRQGGGFDAFIKQLPLTGEFRISNGRSAGWGGFTTFYTDTSERMRITSGGNVGIGTTSPVGLLNLNNGDIWTNVTSTLRGIQFGFAGPSHGSYRAAVMGGAESYGGTDSGMLTFHTQNGYVTSSIPPERMRITSDGNVGIGTTSPTLGTLQVNGNVYATSFTGSLFGTASFAVSASYTLNATSASFATNASTASFISAIKDGMAAYFQPATNDGYNFIKFDSKVNGGSDMGFILFQDDSEQTSGSLSGEDVRFTMGVFNDFSGTVHSDELWMQGGARLVYNVGSWDSEMNSIIGTPSAKSAGDLYSWNKNNSPVMVMNINGNLGIGTSTAGALLAVNGDAFFASKITIKGSAAGSLGNSSGLQLYQDSGTDTSYLYNYYNGPLLLGTTNTERLRITSGGNVGIDNTSPKTKLDISGIFGVGSKSFTCTNSYTTGLTINLNAHTGVYIKVTMHADLSGYSAVGYMGEYFVQNGSGGYSEPGIIIREVNNTDNGSVIFSANIVDPAGSGARNFELQFKQNSGTASVGTTLIYQIQGTYNSIS